MPTLDPQQEGQPLLPDPRSFLSRYGITFDQQDSEHIEIGGRSYTRDEALSLIEDRLIECDELWGSAAPSIQMDFDAIPKENAWCVENLGHIPKDQLYKTRTWAFFKRVLNQSRDGLYQEICVELEYCEHKNTISRLSLLTAMARTIHTTGIGELDDLPIPLPGEALGVFHLVACLMSLFLLLSKFLNKLCGSK